MGKITQEQLYKIKLDTIQKTSRYKMCFYEEWDYSILKNVLNIRKSGRADNDTYSNCFIMADTETSKKRSDAVWHNHIVAWTISIRAYGYNIVTLWGRKPSEMIDCMSELCDKLQADHIIIYFHNLAYDWVFLRKYMMNQFGEPTKQLNTKSHYPVCINFEKLILKDSLILAQRGLEKWANDLDVDHKKATGKWNYDKIRGQRENYTADELEYIEHDTLAGVECLDKTMQALNKHIYSMPYTATGIPREESRSRGRKNRARESFLRLALSYEQYKKIEKVYHGGFTHANRHLINLMLNLKEDGLISGYDFTSSYPYVLLSEKYPMEAFTPISKAVKITDIIKDTENAYMFRFDAVNIRLKDDTIPMPYLQYSKCTQTVNEVQDNGRILCASYVSIYITEQDAQIINDLYTWDKHTCTEVEYAYKDYLPRWFTDYIFELYENKTMFKGGDSVLYAIAKAKLNSLYGLCVQRSLREDITEQYTTGEYITQHFEDIQTEQEAYQKYLDNNNSILPYQWGVWCTAYATRNLFKLGNCCDEWIYSDTDSCYGIGWDIAKVEQYNNECKQKLTNNGYGAVTFNGKEYWLGVAAHEDGKDDYTQFKVQGAKRYCGRQLADGKLHLTVAGVPKSGVECLHDDINNFRPSLIFDGKTTGKKTHTYFFVENTYIDDNGNETGDSIDLSPCDYLLQSVNYVDWQTIFDDEIEIELAGMEE